MKSDATRRGIRTLIWGAAAFVTGIGPLAAAYNISSTTVAKITAPVVLLVAIYTGIVNALEDKGTIPALFKAPASDGERPVPDDAV